MSIVKYDMCMNRQSSLWPGSNSRCSRNFQGNGVALDCASSVSYKTKPCANNRNLWLEINYLKGTMLFQAHRCKAVASNSGETTGRSRGFTAWSVALPKGHRKLQPPSRLKAVWRSSATAVHLIQPTPVCGIKSKLETIVRQQPRKSTSTFGLVVPVGAPPLASPKVTSERIEGRSPLKGADISAAKEGQCSSPAPFINSLSPSFWLFPSQHSQRNTTQHYPLPPATTWSLCFQPFTTTQRSPRPIYERFWPPSLFLFLSTLFHLAINAAVVSSEFHNSNSMQAFFPSSFFFSFLWLIALPPRLILHNVHLHKLCLLPSAAPSTSISWIFHPATKHVWD